MYHDPNEYQGRKHLLIVVGCVLLNLLASIALSLLLVDEVKALGLNDAVDEGARHGSTVIRKRTSAPRESDRI